MLLGEHHSHQHTKHYSDATMQKVSYNDKLHAIPRCANFAMPLTLHSNAMRLQQSAMQL